MERLMCLDAITSRFVASLFKHVRAKECRHREASWHRVDPSFAYSFAIVLEITNWTTLMVSIICHSFVAG